MRPCAVTRPSVTHLRQGARRSVPRATVASLRPDDTAGSTFRGGFTDAGRGCSPRSFRTVEAVTATSRSASIGTGGWRLLARELSAFGIVGAFCFALDLGLFQVLYASVGVNAVAAKLVSTLVSMTVAFLGHRYWSFSHRERTAVRRSYTLFAAVNATTLAMGLVIVWFVRYPLGQESALVLQAANIFSIALGTVIRFRSYRRWVFPEPRALAEAVTAAPPTSATPVRRQAQSS